MHLVQVEKEMYELDSELDKSDQILEELENVLINFKDHLNDIKTEMTSLQERSIRMNTSLTNRLEYGYNYLQKEPTKNLIRIRRSSCTGSIIDRKYMQQGDQ